MKKYSPLPHLPNIIDTAAIMARIDRLCERVPLILAHPSARGLLANSRRVQQAVRALIRGTISNQNRALKLAMLSHGTWRARVLRELGGAKALAKWAARWASYEARLKTAKAQTPEPSAEQPPAPWRKTPERAAEEERQKAHARKCAKACAHPRIIRDPFKVDGDGLFRLAPVPRLTAPRRESACIPFDIMDYDFNGERLAKLTGADAPIMLWPVEFHMAERLEREMVEARDTAVETPSPSFVIPHKATAADARPKDTHFSMGLAFRYHEHAKEEISASYDGPS